MATNYLPSRDLNCRYVPKMAQRSSSRDRSLLGDEPEPDQRPVEHEQLPQEPRMIAPAGAVGFGQAPQLRAVEPAGSGERRAGGDSPGFTRERAAQPLGDRRHEALLRAIE